MVHSQDGRIRMHSDKAEGLLAQAMRLASEQGVMEMFFPSAPLLPCSSAAPPPPSSVSVSMWLKRLTD